MIKVILGTALVILGALLGYIIGYDHGFTDSDAWSK